MTIAGTRRSNWHRVALVVLLLGACKDPPEQMLMGVAALDDGTAVIHWKKIDRARAERSQWLARVDLDGALLWTSQLSAEVQTSWDSGFSLHDRVVGVRQVSVQRPPHEDGVAFPHVSLEAFSIDDGRRVWKTELASFPSYDKLHDPSHAGRNLYVAGVRTRAAMNEVIDVEGGTAQMLSLDPGSGRILGRHGLPSMIMAPTVVEPEIILHDNARNAHVIEGGSSRARTIPISGVGCAGTGDYHRVLMGPDGLQLLSSPRADPEQATIVELGMPNPLIVLGCALYRDLIVIEVREDTDHAVELRFVDRSGHHHGTVNLDGLPADPESIRQRFVEASSLGGELTRYVPYLVWKEDSSTHLVLVDLERRAVVWTQPPNRILHSVFRVEALWYIVSDQGARIAVIDGSRGVLLAAIRFWPALGTGISPKNVRGGSLWVIGPDWHVARAMPLARLDARTLEPRHVSGTMPQLDAMGEPDLAGLPR